MRHEKEKRFPGDRHALVSRSMRDVQPSETLVNIREMEQRYAFENEMMHAVEHGQAHFESKFAASVYTGFFEKRTSDPVRNAKNYAVIMNTLLRKAAERGGVHPIYLDQISSEYALQIENGADFSEVSHLMGEMFRTCCRLVREHTGKGYSLIVQNTILMIDADISAEISPHALAAQLLATTKLQIQTVALHCGIMDVQYFSKLFKRQYGVTPTQYRNNVTEADR